MHAEDQYGNEAFSMIVLLPNGEIPLSTVIQQLTADKWDAAIQALKQIKVNLAFPRFKIEYGRKLKDDLIALGMQQMFDDKKADFSLISPVPLYVSQVIQKTFAEVNEEGTEAAAVILFAGATKNL